MSRPIAPHASARGTAEGEKMARMILDFSGQQGLVSRFFGDYPYNSSNPQLSMTGGASQYAAGIVNPIAKYGYLSPANGTFTTVFNDTSGTRNTQTSTQVDEVNLFLLIYGLDGFIRRTTSLTQTAITATAVTVVNTSGTDLEFYSASGIRKLFFAYKNSSGTSGDIGVWDLHGVTGTNINGDQLFLSYTSNSNTFVQGDTITGGTSGATGHISFNYYAGTGVGTLFLTSVTGQFQGAETITDAHTHTGTVNATGGGGHNGSVITNFMSSFVSGGTALSGSNARMIVADNGFMYIIDGPFLHKYDGSFTGVTNGSTSAFGVMTPNVLDFPPGYTLIDGIDLRGKLWIALFNSTRDIFANSTTTGVYSNYCGVYVWDRITTGTSTEDFILVPGIREIRCIVTFQGVPTIFTVSSARYTQVRMWNGSTFKVVAELGPEAYPRFHDSVSVNGDMMVWLGNDGKMYYYGATVPGSKNALFCLGDITTQTTATAAFQNSGAIALANDNETEGSGLNTTPEAYYITMLDSLAAKTLKWYPHAQNPASTNQNASVGNYFSMVKALPKLSDTHWLTLFFPSIGNGGSTTVMNINIYFNQNVTSWNGSPIAITQDDAKRGYKTIPMNATGINFIQIGVTYPTNVSIQSIPTISYASIDYSPTTKLL